MNTTINKLSILILVLTLTTGLKAQSDKDYFSFDYPDHFIVLNHSPKIIMDSPEPNFNTLAMRYLEDKFNVLFEYNTTDFLSLFEEYQSEQLEDWMFEELNPTEEEEEITLEDWMFDTEYYNKNKA